MSIIHEAYLFRPGDFAREVLPYAKALANSPDGIKLLLDHTIERFEECSSIPALAIEYGGWDISDLYRDKFSYENPVETQQDDQVNVVFLLGFMFYGHLHPVPSQLGL